MAGKINKTTKLEDLRGLYRAAFEEWALQVGRLDRVRESAAESGVLEEAQGRTTAAEAGYRDTRNRLAEEMTRRAVPFLS
jgi:hypothetical protein